MANNYLLDDNGNLILDDNGEPILDTGVYNQPIRVETAMDIIKSAAREANLIPIGENPSGDMAVECLTILNRLLVSVLGFEVGEQLLDWPNYGDNLVSDWSRPAANSRVVFTSGVPTTLYMPETNSNGARISIIDSGLGFADLPVTLDAGSRSFLNGGTTLTLDVTGTNKTFLYRADIGKWALINDIELFDPMPYPLDCSDFFILKLAMRINPRYGRTVAQETIDAANRAIMQLRARYRQKKIVGVDSGLLNMSTSRRSIIGGLALSGDEF